LEDGYSKSFSTRRKINRLQRGGGNAGWRVVGDEGGVKEKWDRSEKTTPGGRCLREFTRGGTLEEVKGERPSEDP